MSSSQDNPSTPFDLTKLDLAPAWAQGSRETDSKSKPVSRQTPRTNSRSTDLKPTPDLGNAARRFRDRRPPDSRQAPKPATPAGRDASPEASRHRRAPEPPALPLTVRFIPARHGMEIFSRRLAKSQRAYALIDLTAMFLDRPGALVVRLTPDPQALAAGQTPPKLFQCRLCRQAYLEKNEATQHVLTVHLSDLYQPREETMEPPAGNFVCVARCDLSGELIGPPNYHGYHECLTALHRERFAHLPFESYRARLRMCRDSETIAAWKESMGRRTVYRPLTGAVEKEDAGLDLNSMAELQKHFLQHNQSRTIREDIVCTLPGTAARRLEDQRLRHLVDNAWRRESRSIMRTAITVRGMLRSLGFTAFKTADQRAYMTAVPPHALEAVQTVESIREMIDYVEAHPGCARSALWEHLGFASETNAPGTETRHFTWLVEKGHLVFSHDGALTLPGHLHAIRTPTSRHRRGRRHT